MLVGVGGEVAECILLLFRGDTRRQIATGNISGKPII